MDMERFNHPEQIILQVAEEEFIKKGFHGARTITIAKKAGVSLATLHSFFKTKEDLFQIVFLKKVEMMAISLLTYEDGTSLKNTLRGMTTQLFDLLAKNPGLVNFIYTEVLSNDDNRQHLFSTLSHQLRGVFVKFAKMIRNEAGKGNIKPVNPMDLLLNLIALNIFSFMAYPAVKDFMAMKNQKEFDTYIKSRKENNVQFILDALRP